MPATTERLTRARKTHQCCLCLDPIPAGAEYIKQRITAWESEQAGGDPIFWTYKAHSDCDEYWRLECCDICEGDTETVAGPEFKLYMAEWQREIAKQEQQGDGQRGGG